MPSLIFECRVKFVQEDKPDEELIKITSIPLDAPVKSIENLATCQTAMVKMLNALSALMKTNEYPVKFDKNESRITKKALAQFQDGLRSGLLRPENTWVWKDCFSGNQFLAIEFERTENV